MDTSVRIAVGSDIHYASRAEQARGKDYELKTISNPAVRLFARFYRHIVWARDPLGRNYLLDRFIQKATPDEAVICGDLTCDTGFIGLSDPAALESAQECLSKLRSRFSAGAHVALGDHDLGKMTLFRKQGGMRLRSYEIVRDTLRCPDFWVRQAGRYSLVGIASSLVAYPAFETEALEQERAGWAELRRQHMERIHNAFAGLAPGAKVILFCHDPTALPYLLELEAVRTRLAQIEHTFIGHLHSRLIMVKSRILSGMPRITFLGHTVSKLSGALRKARQWRPFRVVLCPALAGIELLKDGAFCELELDPEAQRPARISLKRLGR